MTRRSRIFSIARTKVGVDVVIGVVVVKGWRGEGRRVVEVLIGRIDIHCLVVLRIEVGVAVVMGLVVLRG